MAMTKKEAAAKGCEGFFDPEEGRRALHRARSVASSWPLPHADEILTCGWLLWDNSLGGSLRVLPELPRLV